MNTNKDLLKIYEEGKFGLLKKMILENIEEELNGIEVKETVKTTPKVRKRKPETIINSMFKSKRMKHDMTFGNKAMQMKDGRFAFTDGYRVFISDTDMGYEKGQVNLDAMLETDFDCEIEIDINKVIEKIAENKEHKTDLHPVVFEVDNYKIGMNPKYLKDLIDFTGLQTLKYNKKFGRKYKSLASPLYAVNSENKIMGCVLPVNLVG